MNSIINQRLGNWSERAYFAGIVLMSAIVIPLPALGFVLPKILVGSLTALVVLALLLHRENRSLPRSSPLSLCVLLYVLVLLLSQFWSVAPSLSRFGAVPRFEGLFTHLIAIVLGIVTATIVSTSDGRTTVLKAIVVSNAIVVFYGFVQWLGIDPLRLFWEVESFLGRIFSSVGQPNFLGSFILLTMPFTVLAACQSGRRRLLLLTVLSVLNVVVLLQTASRGALLGLATMVLIVVISKRNVLLPFLRQYLVYTAVIAAVLLMLGVQSFSNRFAVSTQSGAALGSRSVIWPATIEMIKARPLGYGLETMGIVSPQFIGKEIYAFESLTTRIDRAHSQPLDIWFALGPLGFLLYFLIVWKVLRRCYAKRKSDPMLAAAGIGILGYVVSVLVGFETFLTMAFFWILVGMVVGGVEASEGKMRSFALSICLVFCLLSSFVLLQWTSARFTMQDAQGLVREGRLTEAIAMYDRAEKQFRRLDRSLLIESIETALLVREQASDRGDKMMLDRFIEEKITKLHMLTRGRDGLVYLLGAWSAALRGETGGVQTAFELMPEMPVTYRLAARSYSLLGQTEQERETLRKLQSILPVYWNDENDERGRILRKNNPWVLELLE